jgi:hypothetical protein
MYKKLILLSFLSISRLVDAQADQSLSATIDAYVQAYAEMSKQRGNLRYVTHTEHSGDMIITRRFPVGSPDGIAAWNNYRSASSNLQEKTLEMSVGEGFILGATIAGINRKINGSKINKKAIGSAIVLSSIALKLYHNQKMPMLFYYDNTLSIQQNWFAQASFNTLGHMLGTMASATIAFIGTNYSIDRFIEFKNNKNKAKLDTEQKPA